MHVADTTPHHGVSLLRGIRECVAMRLIRRHTLTFVAFSVLGAIADLGVPRPTQAQAAKPNIVFILMDNLGYGELGVYGGGITRGAPTARMDQLAADGMRLTNFNVEAQCTPSRSAIITGRFSIRSGTHSVPIGGGLDGLTQWEVTIAEVLSSGGYATGSFGKWHLDSEQGRLPNDQGFDEWYGIPRTTAATDRRGDHASGHRFHAAECGRRQTLLWLCSLHTCAFPDVAKPAIRRQNGVR
jgi:Sulfatase